MNKLPMFRLVAEPVTDEARLVQGFKWAGREIGTRHQIGGNPHWLQGEHVPNCKQCRTEMTFYGQLDSIGDGFTLADCGLIYVFVCFDCYAAKAFIQSY